MAVNLVRHLDRLTRRVENQEFRGAAERMEDVLSNGARAAMGGDLTFSGGGGTVVIKGDARRGRVVVEVGGAYGLANTGRHQAPGARGGSWGGFGITARYGRRALRAGVDGVVDEVDWG